MYIAILYLTLMLSCSIYSTIIGGVDARKFVFTIILATVFTNFSQDTVGFSKFNCYVVFIDFLVLILFYIFCLKSKFYWPLWITATQLLTVLSHMSIAFVPSYNFPIYFALQSIWSVIGQFLMAYGTFLDKKSKLLE
jgi:hypothetical protein